MKEPIWYAIIDMFMILLALLLIGYVFQGCDLMDPKNSVNSIYLEETDSTSQRFTKIYVSQAGRGEPEITVYKDNEHEGCELIIVWHQAGYAGGLGVTYVNHDKRIYVR